MAFGRALLIGCACFICGCGTHDTLSDSALPHEIEAYFRSKGRARQLEIQNTPNLSIPKNAPAWYVSAQHGDDAADGRSPATAWKTALRLNREAFPKGSYVLFERGGIYRGSIRTRPGVTYSAYGKGPKPLLYGSPQNGAEAKKWLKTDAPNVWAYVIGHDDVGTLVFNEGAAHAIKIVIRKDFKTGATFNKYTGGPFASYRDLAGDLHFWHDYSPNGTGKIYLYSKQNPGERFKSIEFNVKGHVFVVKHDADVTIDNLSIKYVGGHGVSAGGGHWASKGAPKICRGLTVQNCEFAWIGGSIMAEHAFGRDYPTRYGNGVEIFGGCDDYRVENCYFQDVYDAGVTHQFNIPKKIVADRHDQKNIRYANNVFERCCYSIEYFLTVPKGNLSRMENVVIENNLCFDAGKGFSAQRPDRGVAAHIRAAFSSQRNRARGYVIRNNVFCRSQDDLVMICSGLRNEDGSSSLPQMENNIFIGMEGDTFGMIAEKSGKSISFDRNTQSFVDQFGPGNRCVLAAPITAENL